MNRLSYSGLCFCIFFLLELTRHSGAVDAPTESPTPSPTISPSSFLSIYNNIYLVAGSTASPVSSGTGGKATSASFVGPLGMYQSSAGVLYISDYSDNCVRSFNPTTDSIVKIVAGVCGSQGDQQNKPATSAFLKEPSSVYGDTTGNVFIADYGNHKIKKIDGSGTISVYAGTGDTDQSGDGGKATDAHMGYPFDCAVDSSGAMYVLLTFSSVVRKIALDDIVSLYAGK